ncbi:MAG: hypothetical protein WD960_00920 [Gemmatimonadota bacterium]
MIPLRDKVGLACWSIPLLMLAGSYAWLAMDHGTVRLWSVVVHESGRYTLGETVLYFSHFLREVPTVVAYALFLLGSSGAVQPGSLGSAGVRRGMGWAALALATALVGGALIRTAQLQGGQSAFLDLAQYRTRDDLVGYGTHWRYHWLSTLWFGAAAGLAPLLLNRLLGARALRLHGTFLAAAWGYSILLTLVFGLSEEVFRDIRYVGHQAREIMTHGPTTLLLGMGILLAAGGSEKRGNLQAFNPPRWMTAGFAGLVLLIPVYLAGLSLTGDVMEHGQTAEGLAAMVAAHYFEHSLDYILALLLLVSGLALVSLRSVSATAAPSTRR